MGTSNLQDHLIDEALAGELATNYENKNYASINAKRPAGKPDAKEFKFSFELLDEYFTFIKSQISKEDYKKLTISIQLGQYPEDRIVGPLQDPDTKGYQTVCLIPVFDGKSETENKPEEKGAAAGLPGLNFAGLCPPN